MKKVQWAFIGVINHLGGETTCCLACLFSSPSLTARSRGRVFARFDGHARAVRCAHAIRAAACDISLQVRLGLHTGECEVLDGKVAGIAVAIGARVSARGQRVKYWSADRQRPGRRVWDQLRRPRPGGAERRAGSVAAARRHRPLMPPCLWRRVTTPSGKQAHRPQNERGALDPWEVPGERDHDALCWCGPQFRDRGA